jgi:hypothetical protein
MVARNSETSVIIGFLLYFAESVPSNAASTVPARLED